MAKADEWRRKVDEWKAVLNQAKNAGLKAGRGTGISESIRKVADAEVDYVKAKEPAKGAILVGVADLCEALDALATLCKKTTDKHSAVFTEACRHLTALREAAISRRTEATREVDELRRAVGQRCAAAAAQLRGARSIADLAKAWSDFADDFEAQGKAFSTLKTQVNNVKAHRAPDANRPLDQERPVFLRLVQACEAATNAR